MTNYAAQMLTYLETGTRDDGSTFLALRDGRPEWMRDVAYAAHGNGDRLPNDWDYEHLRDALEALAEDLDAEGFTFADVNVPVYTNDLTKWLHEFPGACGMCDEAAGEYGIDFDDILNLIRAGYCYYLQGLFENVKAALPEAE